MPRGLPGWWKVARWELWRTLRRADFIVSVLVTPILFVVVMAGLEWLEGRSRSRVDEIAVVRAGSGLRLWAIEGVRWIEPSGTEPSRDSLLQAVREKRYVGALLVPASFASSGRAELIVRREMPRLRHRISTFLQKEARAQRALAHGVDSAGLAHIDAKIALDVAVANQQARTTRTDRIVAIGLMILVLTVIIIASSYTMIGISAEKQARVTEIVLSAISAQAWMDGKIVAYSALGLLNGFVWALTAVWLLVSAAWSLPGSLTLGTAAISTLYGALGLALYVGFFAALMATLKDFQSVSKLQGNLILLPLLPVFVMKPVLESPEAPFAIVTSLIPFFSPMIMPMRIALGQAALWEIVLGLALLATAVWFMRWLAGATLRVGMLMYGKDVNLPELIRLAKQS